jgi:hypothetical protein
MRPRTTRAAIVAYLGSGPASLLERAQSLYRLISPRPLFLDNDPLASTEPPLDRITRHFLDRIRATSDATDTNTCLDDFFMTLMDWTSADLAEQKRLANGNPTDLFHVRHMRARTHMNKDPLP